MATIGRPAITAPAQGTDKALKTWQQQLNNIRERFQALETVVSTLETTTTARAESAATSTAAIQRELRSLLARVTAALAEVQQLLDLFSLEEAFVDGDIWVYRDEFAKFVPEPGGDIGGGAVLPVVTGEVPPVLVYLDDGSLVYSELED
jgi:hypothetical protein